MPRFIILVCPVIASPFCAAEMNITGHGEWCFAVAVNSYHLAH